jgi:hypothetical protein
VRMVFFMAVVCACKVALAQAPFPNKRYWQKRVTYW